MGNDVGMIEGILDGVLDRDGLSVGIEEGFKELTGGIDGPEEGETVENAVGTKLLLSPETHPVPGSQFC